MQIVVLAVVLSLAPACDAVERRAATGGGAAPTLAIRPDTEIILPGRFVEYFAEAHALPIRHPREFKGRSPGWQASHEDYPNPGLSSQSYWFRLQLRSAAPHERVLYFPHSMDDLEIFMAVGESDAVAVCNLGRRAGPLRARRPACRLQLPAGVARIYIRIANEDSLWLPARLLSDGAYHLRQERENLLYGAYFGVLLIMALYNLLVYVRTREASFLPYVAFTVANIFYFFVQSGFAAFIFYSGHPHWHGFIGPTSAALFGATACAFADSFLRLRVRSPWLHRALLLAQGALAILWLIVVARPSPLVAVGAARLLGGLGFGICLLLPLIALNSIRGGFAPARIYFAAVFAFFVGGALFIARILGWAPANWITLYAFPIGSLLQVALFSQALADRIQDLQRAVARSLANLETAHRELARSEDRYRQLVEGSRDLIFVLDSGGYVRQVNAAIRALLGMRAADAIDRQFGALLYSPPDSEASRGYQEALLEAQLQNLKSGTATRFALRLANRLGQPVDLDMTLERLADPAAQAANGAGGEEGALILGRAGPPERNVLVAGLVSERGVYTIGNFLSEADALYHRATVFLARFYSESSCEMIVFALREMIMNAIEHGNLGITFDEKTRAQEEGRYLELLLERQRRPDLRDRRVRLEYSLSSRWLIYRVTDEGAGFDHRRICRAADDLMGDLQVSHGRGIALARQFFDVVRYNEKGNSVTLIRRSDDG